MKIDNSSFERVVEELKYLGTTLTNQHSMVGKVIPLQARCGPEGG